MTARWIVFVAACVALAGCATSNRPAEGPGSGSGAEYVPDVRPTANAAPDYEATVAKCQRWARDLPYMRTGQHDAALGVIGFGAGFAFGYLTPLVGIDFVAATTIGASGFGGFGYFVEGPERAAWRSKQETIMANCMTMAGYENNDPSIRVTYVKYAPLAETIRRTGVDTYSAEKLAKARSCSATPLADMVAKGPGFERHKVVCTSGVEIAIRCEFGNCRVLQ